MEFDQIFNLSEGIFWMIIALVLLKQLRRNETSRDLILIAASGFFLFGISDFIEVFTRAWHEPFLLLILNAACVITFMITLGIYRRRKKKEKRAGENFEQARANERSVPDK